MNKNIDNNFYIKMLDGTEHEFKKTDWPKLSQESKTNLENGILDKKIFNEILMVLGVTLLLDDVSEDDVPKKIPDTRKISQIEIPKCVKLLGNTLKTWGMPNLLGIKIHNDKAEIRGGVFGGSTPSLMCVQSKSEFVKKYFNEYCARDIKIFENDSEYETSLKNLKSQKIQEYKVLFTCETSDGPKEFFYSKPFENPYARRLNMSFISSFCKSENIDPKSISKIKLFEGPRLFSGIITPDIEIPNLKELEIPEGTYYLPENSLFMKNHQLDSLILPSSLVTLYNINYGDVLDVCNPFGHGYVPKRILIKNNNNTCYNNKYKEFFKLKCPETEIFDNEKKFYGYEESHDDKGFIKIKDTNGKIYEHELKFGNYKICDVINGGQCEYSAEDKYLSEEMLIDILENLGLGKNQVSEIEIPYGVKNLGYRSFIDYVKLKKITLPDSLEKIDAFAFHGCESLEELYIPESVKNVCLYSIGFCRNLKKLVINKNTNFDKLALYSGNNSLSEIIIIKNPEAEEAVKYATKMKAVPEDVKIFNSMEEYEKCFKTEAEEVLHDEEKYETRDELCEFKNETSAQKYKTKEERSYSELIDLKSLTLIWFIYKFIVITIYKFNHNILGLEECKQNKETLKNKTSSSNKTSLRKKIESANYKSQNKNNIIKLEQKNLVR